MLNANTVFASLADRRKKHVEPIRFTIERNAPHRSILRDANDFVARGIVLDRIKAPEGRAGDRSTLLRRCEGANWSGASWPERERELPLEVETPGPRRYRRGTNRPVRCL